MAQAFRCDQTFDDCGRPMNAYEVSTDRQRLDVAAIHAFLTQSYWSPNVPRETVETAIRNSMVVGAYSGALQVGFARAITDCATFAYFADVYVLEAHRGHGIALRMMTALRALPELQGLRRMLLATRDAHELYTKIGFRPLAAPHSFMERHNPNAYAPIHAVEG